MKKSVLLLLFILCPLLMANAQLIRFGAKAGAGFFSVKGDDGSSDVTNSLASFHGGFIGSYEFVSKLAVQAELLYDQKGFVYDGYPINSDEVLVDDHRLHYITLPVMLKIQKGGLFAEAGPYAGYLIAETASVEVIDRASVNESDPVILRHYPLTLNNFERWDFGYTAGIGIQLDNGFFMSVHNTGGFKSFSKELDQKNVGFKLSVGYLMSPKLP